MGRVTASSYRWGRVAARLFFLKAMLLSLAIGDVVLRHLPSGGVVLHIYIRTISSAQANIFTLRRAKGRFSAPLLL